MRKRIMLRASRTADRISRKEKPTAYDARQMLSYMGWIKATDTHAWAEKWIYSKVNIRELRKIISNADKAKRRLK